MHNNICRNSGVYKGSINRGIQLIDEVVDTQHGCVVEWMALFSVSLRLRVIIAATCDPSRQKRMSKKLTANTVFLAIITCTPHTICSPVLMKKIMRCTVS